MTLIYAAADIHGKPERIDLVQNKVLEHHPDVLVLAGDTVSGSDPEKTIQRIADTPVTTLLIRGNTDRKRKFNDVMTRFPKIKVLNSGEKYLKNTHFVGIGGTLPLPFRSMVHLEEKKLLTALSGLVRPGETVLIGHPPPYGVLDEVIFGIHAGSKGFRNVLSQKKPRVYICGHIHHRNGAQYFGETLVVNCSMGKSGAGYIVNPGSGNNPPECEPA